MDRLLTSKSAMTNSPLGYAYHRIICDKEGNPVDYEFLDVNCAYEKMTGLKSENIIGKNVSEVSPDISDDNFDWIKYYGDVALSGIFKTAKQYSNTMDRWYKVFVSSPENGYFILQYSDIDDIAYLVYYDKLTGLYNSNYTQELFELLDICDTYPFSIIYIDINGLRKINNEYGYKIGDSLIKQISEILQRVCSCKGIVSRQDGEEFGIFLSGTDEEDAEILCEKIRKNIEQLKIYIDVSLSYGISSKKQKGDSVRTVELEAVNNMFKEKLIENQSSRGLVTELLLRALGAKSFETLQHTERLQENSIKIANRIGLKKSDIDNLILLAKLHDIGKIAISEEILKKPDALNKKEWDILKQHCQAGKNIVRTTHELYEVGEGILSHHERWDGNGYPFGLKGEEIPLISRIINIVDSFDVMIHGRPYKNAMSVYESILEIERCSGFQFDPKLADIFCEIINEECIEISQVVN